MELTILNNGILQINDARIIYRNFTGEKGLYNKEGDRNFAWVIPDEETSDLLIAEGWNVKIREPRTPEEEPFRFMPIKMKWNAEGRGPRVYLISGSNRALLGPNEVGIVDHLAIENVDMDIRPYFWEEGQPASAWLQAMEITQRLDRFEERNSYYDDKTIFKV